MNLGSLSAACRGPNFMIAARRGRAREEIVAADQRRSRLWALDIVPQVDYMIVYRNRDHPWRRCTGRPPGIRRNHHIPPASRPSPADLGLVGVIDDTKESKIGEAP